MNSQKIALFAKSDEVSQRLLAEALKRGHVVTAIVPDKNEMHVKHPNLKIVKGDVKKKEDVNRYARGNDVVICAYTPTKTNPREHIDITRSVIEGVKDTGVNSILFAAHPLGMPVENTEEFYNSFKPVLQAQREALGLCRDEKWLRWGYAHSVEPQESKLEPGRAPKYTFSEEILFAHPEGENRIPVKDYVSAVLDESEKGEMELHGYGEEESRED